MALQGYPGRQLIAFFLWVTGIDAAFDFRFYGLTQNPWMSNGLQIAAYALLVVPIIIWSPSTTQTLRAPRSQILCGAGCVVVAVVLASTDQLYPGALLATVVGFAATGFGEEFSFRGFVWGRLQRMGLHSPAVVAVNATLFTASHLPEVISGRASANGLVSTLLFGVLISLVRLWCGNTTLPALLHMADDILGII